MKTQMFLADVRPCTLCGSDDCKHLGGPNHNIRRVYQRATEAIDTTKLLMEYVREQEVYGNVFGPSQLVAPDR